MTLGLLSPRVIENRARITVIHRWLNRVLDRLWPGFGVGSNSPTGIRDRSEGVALPGGAGNLPQKPRLLLVEDDWQTHSALRKVLTRMGWEVDSAPTVAGALAMLELRPQAMILDLMLADGVGLEVLRHVRNVPLAVRVVVTTGTANSLLRDEVERLKPDAMIDKPVDLDELLLALGIPDKASDSRGSLATGENL